MSTGTLTTASAYSAALGEHFAYTVYLPPGYGAGTDRHPVLYLLHGRGEKMRAWTRVKDALDALIRDGVVPPVIAVMPDAPWSRRGNWYVDSAYTGSGNGSGNGAGNGADPMEPGRPVETAIVRDLVPAVDARYRTVPTRQARLIGGNSMGGAGAVRLALAHQELFAHALVLSPAAYVPLPSARSNTRVYGAFGAGERLFDDAVYRRLNYPALLPSVDPALPVHIFIAVGRGEYAAPGPAGERHDIGSEHEVLYGAVRRVPGIRARAQVLDGGHNWGTWLPAFVAGMTALGPGLATVAPVGPPSAVPAPDGSRPRTAIQPVKGQS
jgi:enterochelin esterase-like enzyme